MSSYILNLGENMGQRYTGPERRVEVHISDEQIETIAQRAAEKAIKQMTDNAYRAVGKNVVEKFFYIIGVCALGLLGMAIAKGWIQLPGSPPQ